MSFQLVNTQTVLDKYLVRTWKNPTKFYFKGLNTIEFYPAMINQYLKICSDQEIKLLLEGTHFLRMKCYNDGSGESYVEIVCLDLAGLDEEGYREMLENVPSGVCPCIIYSGPFWHFFGLFKPMIVHRLLTPSVAFPGGFILGLELYARDAYPGETEEQIQAIEKLDQISIGRKKSENN